MFIETYSPQDIKRLIGNKKFRVYFRKKNNEVRIAYCDFKIRNRWKVKNGEWRKLKGGSSKNDSSKYLLAFDIDKGDYININYEGIKYLKVGTQHYVLNNGAEENVKEVVYV